MMRALTVGLALLCGLAVGANAAIVSTRQGPVEGLSRQGVSEFLGLAYAKPPLGPLRWMPPQAPEPWTGVRRATQFAPTCAQVTTLGPFAGPPNNNEDCLYLNVFTPDLKARLPVLVWIHGGGYYDGESNDYDATKLAKRGKLVVVTINYRLNLFGFMANPAIDREGHPFGNYGIMDMQAALKWVKQNIASFGGDPDNVTVGGQSAGAGAAAALVISPATHGLIQRAIFQSGGYTPFTPKEIAEQRGQKFAEAAGCRSGDIAACLRKLPASKVEALAGTPAATGPFFSTPMVDGTVIPQQEIDAITSGHFNRVPILFGTTRDEGNFFNGVVQYFKKGRAPLTVADFRAYLEKSYGGNAGPAGSAPPYPKATVDAVLNHYPPAKLGVQMAWDRAHSDMLACRGQYTAQALAAYVPVYMYLFDDPTAPSYFPKMPGYQALAYHTGDIGYLFVGYHGGPQGLATSLNPRQEQLSDHLIDAWARFARTANPNGQGDLPWPRWKKGAKERAYFIENNDWKSVQTNAEFAAAHQCSFWNTILRYK